MSVALIREMFAEMVVRKNPDLVARYHHPDFLLTTNGSTQDYTEFDRGHRAVYDTDISYALRDGLIHRLWELTRPDWSQLEQFADCPAGRP